MTEIRNCLTVDVEEWFHICGAGGALAPSNWDALPTRVAPTTEIVLDLLDRTRVRATFFVLGWVADRHPSVIQRILNAGHEIGCHGYSHTRLYEMTADELSAELDACGAIFDALGAPAPRGFRAPEWSINNRSMWALDVLARCGYRYDASMAPLRVIGDPTYSQIPRTIETTYGPLMEFPPLVHRRLGQNLPLGVGWGLRMSKPRRVIEVIRERNARGEPVSLAIHPWELDPEPPRAAMPVANAFAHYFRLGGFRARLETILEGADWAAMEDVLGVAPVTV